MDIDLSDVAVALGMPNEFTKMLQSEVADDNDMVLEAGCGTGKLGMSLAMVSGCTVFLLDNDPDALRRSVRILRSAEEVVLKRLPVVYKQGDVLGMPFKDRSFDFVFNEGVIEHFTDPLVPLKEMCRVSRRSVAVITPNSLNAEQQRQAGLQMERHKGTSSWSAYEHLIPEEALKGFFEKAGLTDVQQGYMWPDGKRPVTKETCRMLVMIGRRP